MSEKIVCNNVPRHLIYGHDLPLGVHKDFDYMEDILSGTFFKYKGQYFDVGEFLCCPHDLDELGWHGYAGQSYFHAVLIKLSDCGDYVTVGGHFT